MREMVERCGKRGLPQCVPTFGNLPSGEKGLGKARQVLELVELVLFELRLAASHRVTVACIADGCAKQYVERQLAAQ